MCPPRLIRHSLVPVAEKAEVHPAELGIRTRVDHHLLYSGLLVVSCVARRGWLRGGGRTAQRLWP